MAENTAGSFGLVLHMHAPHVVSHGRWPYCADRLYEACAESYIPLLDMIHELIDEEISPRMTISISPILCEQLKDKRFNTGFRDYLDRKIQAANTDKEVFARYGYEKRENLAEMWVQFHTQVKEHFKDKYDQDIIEAFKNFQDEGHIEIMTSAATHAYLPLLSQDTTVQTQIKLAVSSYEKHFGRKPRGIWLPECAYHPRSTWTPPFKIENLPDSYPRKGIEEFLSENGLEYFIIDSHLLGGSIIGAYADRFKQLRLLGLDVAAETGVKMEMQTSSPYDIYKLPSKSTARPRTVVFTRDPLTGVQIRVTQTGYLADGNYLDFDRKHFPGGHRYRKFTSIDSNPAEKEIYNPKIAQSRVPENAAHFKSLIKTTLEEYQSQSGKKGFLCAPFNCELFGQYWFEGMTFLKHIIEYIYHDDTLGMQTLSERLDEAGPADEIKIAEGSWGEGGKHQIWCNPENDWSWKHIYADEIRMQTLAANYKDRDDKDLQEILRQTAIELMLLIESDWQFILSARNAAEFAEIRLSHHHENFNRLADMAEKQVAEEKITEEEWTFLKDLQRLDDIFPDMELGWLAEVEFSNNSEA